MELQLPAYATATETWDPSHLCNLHHSSWQCQLPDPLSKAGNGTHILMDTSRICIYCTEKGTPDSYIFDEQTGIYGTKILRCSILMDIVYSVFTLHFREYFQLLDLHALILSPFANGTKMFVTRFCTIHPQPFEICKGEII